MGQAPSICIDHVKLTNHKQEVRECKTNVSAKCDLIFSFFLSRTTPETARVDACEQAAPLQRLLRLPTRLPLPAGQSRPPRGAEQQQGIDIDDVKLTHYGQEVRECKTNVCGANGRCYEYDDDDDVAESHCCCTPGFCGERCEQRHRPMSKNSNFYIGIRSVIQEGRRDDVKG